MNIYEELDYLLNDICYYGVPIRISDALRAAKEELDTTNNLLDASGARNILNENMALKEINKALREEVNAVIKENVELNVELGGKNELIKVLQGDVAYYKANARGNWL